MMKDNFYYLLPFLTLFFVFLIVLCLKFFTGVKGIVYKSMLFVDLLMIFLLPFMKHAKIGEMLYLSSIGMKFSISIFAMHLMSLLIIKDEKQNHLPAVLLGLIMSFFVLMAVSSLNWILFLLSTSLIYIFGIMSLSLAANKTTFAEVFNFYQERLLVVALIILSAGSLAVAHQSLIIGDVNTIDFGLQRIGIVLLFLVLIMTAQFYPFSLLFKNMTRVEGSTIYHFLANIFRAAIIIAILTPLTKELDLVSRDDRQVWNFIFVVLSIGSIYYGNIRAVVEDKISSIPEYGWHETISLILLSLLVGGMQSVEVAVWAVVFFSFGNILWSYLGVKYHSSLMLGNINFVAMLKDHKWPSYIFVFLMFSIAGFPGLTSFAIKFFMIRELFGHSMNWQGYAVLVGFGVGAVFYIRSISQVLRPVVNKKNITIKNVFYSYKERLFLVLSLLILSSGGVMFLLWGPK